MTGGPAILGADGRPLQRPRAMALAGSSGVPYDAADRTSGEMAGWYPYLASPDGELNVYRDRIVSRIRDLVRNDGWASGGVTRIVDNAVGATFRPIPQPDYRALASYTGISAFDAEWSHEYRRALVARYRTWANDPGRYCDAARNLIVPQMFRVAFRHKIVDGDALAVLLWLPERVEPGRARYATAVQLVDPDRLSNPQNTFDTATQRGGVEIDPKLGDAVAYHLRRAHQGDWWAASDSLTWDRIPRETSWGRPIVVHDFDHDRAGQHRGGAGVLAPVLSRLKMLASYDRTELEAALVNAIFGAFIESPNDPQLVEEALGDGEKVGALQDLRKDYHENKRLALGGVRMPILFPGEKISSVTAARPSSNFAAFEAAVLRNGASALGISAQQLSNNWSDVNYSSARAALLEFWKTLTRRRADFGAGFATPIFAAFVEEEMDRGELPLPAGAPEFMEFRAAYARCRWQGPGRGWIDPVAEKQGAVLGMDAGLSTLEQEVSDNSGEDWEEVLDQRVVEIKGFADRGLTPPSWAQMNVPASSAAQPPQQPQPK